MKNSPETHRMERLKKGGSPGPTDYDAGDAMNKTLTHFPEQPIGKFSPKCYFEEKALKKKFVPGTGTYSI